jgi:hypothetical protein
MHCQAAIEKVASQIVQPLETIARKGVNAEDELLDYD